LPTRRTFTTFTTSVYTWISARPDAWAQDRDLWKPGAVCVPAGDALWHSARRNQVDPMSPEA
jgi:hypothetical protein